MQFREVYFDIYPRVVETGRQAEIKIRPRFEHSRFLSGIRYFASISPALGAPGQSTRSDEVPRPIVFNEGGLTIKATCLTEQEYIVSLWCRSPDAAGADAEGESAATTGATDGATAAPKKTGKLEPVGAFSIYALDRDLFERVPLKGDFHLHSSYSDGWESPAYVAASCRKIGLDFMALTDHAEYGPSLEAIERFAGVDIDLEIFPGEEVHPPDSEAHIVNFGGRYGINELFSTEQFKRELKAEISSLGDLPDGMDARIYASAAWSFKRIRDAGGLGVFCHPYWATENRLVLPIAVTDLLFERQPFDALELISGYFKDETESNLLQVVRYSEEGASGKRIPIVGASDAHGCERGELFGWYYTIVFSQSPELDSIINGVKTLYSVAVESVPGETVRVHGPMRLVTYSLFLLKNVFPSHDELCAEEGRYMLSHAAGDNDAATKLASLSGGTAELYRRLWDRN